MLYEKYGSDLEDRNILVQNTKELMQNEEQIDIAFVILNYNIVTELINCVRSIEMNIDTKGYKIIIVDNCSSRDIQKKIEDALSLDNAVRVVFADCNYGFAKGNNIGIIEAQKYNPRFICCMNNDTLFIQKDFYSILNEEYLKNEVALIGPMIILKDNSIQRYSNNLKTVEQYKEIVRNYEDELHEPFYISVIKNNTILYRLGHAIKKKLKKKDHAIDQAVDPFIEKNNVLIHGCCIIFTPLFFTKLNGFDERTFLYREEEILYYDVKSCGLSTMYQPKLFIKHLEDVSTNSEHKRRSDKNRRYLECQISSLRVLISKMEKKDEF